VKKLRGGTGIEARGIITTAPGDEAQVNYGEGPMVLHSSGKHRRTRLFVLTLGHSRKSVRLLTWRSSTRIWAQLHERPHPEPCLPGHACALRSGRPALPGRRHGSQGQGRVSCRPCSSDAPKREALRQPRRDPGLPRSLGRARGRHADHGTIKRQVPAVYAEELPALRSLPLEPVRYYAPSTSTDA
jgi:hypothetical protein